MDRGHASLTRASFLVHCWLIKPLSLAESVTLSELQFKGHPSAENQPLRE